MSCVKQTSKKYTERPSPPIKAKDCKGKTKKGNDGSMYVSKAASNGVYRWSKVSTKTTSKKTTKKASKTTTRKTTTKRTTPKKPCKPGQERNPLTGRCKKIAQSVVSLFTGGPVPTPRTRKPSTRKVSGTITVLARDIDGVKFKATFVPWDSEPEGKKWLLFDEEEKEFSEPTFGEDKFGNKPIEETEVQVMLKKGYPVWVVDGIPRKYQN